MNSIVKGGRGKKAPYTSTHYRIPQPIRPVVEKLAAVYRACVEEGSDLDELLEPLKEH